jgi:hypothetical protein
MAGIDMNCTAFEIAGGAIDTFPISNDTSAATRERGPTGILRETAMESIYTASGSRSHQAELQRRSFIEVSRR